MGVGKALSVYDVDPVKSEALVGAWSLRNACVTFYTWRGTPYRAEFISRDHVMAVIHSFSEYSFKYDRLGYVREERAEDAEVLRTCERIQSNLCARTIFDIGGLMKVPRAKMLDILFTVDKDLDHWVESIENVLEFTFPLPLPLPQPAGHDPARAPESASLVKTSFHRVSAYTTAGEIGLGAQLLSEKKLDAVVFVYAMFVKLVTANPKAEYITEAELIHILDTVFEYTFSMFGKVNIDKIYRVHVGRNLRLLFPWLPNRGSRYILWGHVG